MDGITLQDRIYHGYGRTADVVGREYAIYRASFSPEATVTDSELTDLDPVVEANKVRDMNVSFSADKDFSVPNKYLSPTRYCYADGRKLQQFDIMVGPFGTFFVGDMQPLLPIQAIKCNRTINIGRGIYSTEGPIGQTVHYYATRLPVFMQFAREDIKSSVVGTAIGQAITHWTVFMPLPNGMVRQDDVAFDEEGNRYLIDAPNFSSIGYVTHLRLARL